MGQGNFWSKNGSTEVSIKVSEFSPTHGSSLQQKTPFLGFSHAFLIVTGVKLG